MFRTFQVAILEKCLCTVLILLISACLFPGLKSHDLNNNLQVWVDWRKYFHTFNKNFYLLLLSPFSFNGRVQLMHVILSFYGCKTRQNPPSNKYQYSVFRLTPSCQHSCEERNLLLMYSKLIFHSEEYKKKQISVLGLYPYLSWDWVELYQYP